MLVGDGALDVPRTVLRQKDMFAQRFESAYIYFCYLLSSREVEGALPYKLVI